MPNAGFRALLSEEVEVVVAVPELYPVRVVVIVAAEAVLAETSEIVARPLLSEPLNVTVPPRVAVPLHVKAGS